MVNRIVKVQNLVAVSKDTYMKDGKEKRQYVNIGAVFTDDKNNVSVDIEFLPSDRSKWFFNIFDREKKE